MFKQSREGIENMITMKSSEAPSLVTAAPFERELKVLLSPLLQEKVQGFSVGMTLLPPGNATSDHVHDNEVEAWLIISGEGEAKLGAEKKRVSPETAIFVPPNTSHQLVNTGSEELRMFWVYSPPGAEKAVLTALQK
jgi:mannose-6-phosphate isomerase-like protein (cupin superfamily)